jgi:hypothetical protein
VCNHDEKKEEKHEGAIVGGKKKQDVMFYSKTYKDLFFRK